LFDSGTKHPTQSDWVQCGAVDLWLAAPTTQQSTTPNTPDLAGVGHCAANSGDFGTILEIAQFIRRDRNAPAKRLSIWQVTRVPHNPLPFLMIC
jgi:hypothetical protein